MSSILMALAENTVMYYPFSEGTGTTAYDYSINGYDGTLSGTPEWFKIQDGSYTVNFDGSDDFITVTNNATIQTIKSVSFWININGDTNPDSNFARYLVSKQTGAAFSHSISWKENSDELVVYNDSTTILGDYALSLGWHHIVVVFGSGNSFLYADGVLADTGAAFDFFDNSNDLLIGGGGLKRYYDGQLRFLQFFDKELSINEVEKIYQDTYIE